MYVYKKCTCQPSGPLRRRGIPRERRSSDVLSVREFGFSGLIRPVVSAGTPVVHGVRWRGQGEEVVSMSVCVVREIVDYAVEASLQALQSLVGSD